MSSVPQVSKRVGRRAGTRTRVLSKLPGMGLPKLERNQGAKAGGSVVYITICLLQVEVCGRACLSAPGVCGPLDPPGPRHPTMWCLCACGAPHLSVPLPSAVDSASPTAQTDKIQPRNSMFPASAGPSPKSPGVMCSSCQLASNSGWGRLRECEEHAGPPPG